MLAVGASSSGVAVGQEAGGIGGRISGSEDLLDEQGRDLRRQIDEIAVSERDLGEAQAVLDVANGRVGELKKRKSDLSGRLAVATERRKEARGSYEETVRDAYRGGGVEGIGLILDGIIGAEGSGLDPGLVRAISSDAETLQDYREAEAYLRQSQRQLEDTDAAYDEAIGQRARSAERLRGKVRLMRDSADQTRQSLRNTRGIISRLKVERLEKQERRKISKERSATLSAPDVPAPDTSTASTEPTGSVGGASDRTGIYEAELEIVSQEEVFVEEVAPIDDASYLRLYRQAAEQYGFADEWYILAAIGKIESDHGQNLGPSSAGAMGPMQFLPSTWETSGVDGNGDGVANILDPEDAIPAAAGYLQSGGAPEDWYAAIYSYNHADWYVQEVLAVSEGYRRLSEQSGEPTL